MMALVTGTTGFVGSHVASQAAASRERGLALVGASRRPEMLDGLPIDVLPEDLRDLESVKRARRGVNRIYHVAADYRLWPGDSSEIYENYFAVTRNFLEVVGVTGGEPRVPLEAERMSRQMMYGNGNKAMREPGFAPEPVEAALERAGRRYAGTGRGTAGCHALGGAAA